MGTRMYTAALAATLSIAAGAACAAQPKHIDFSGMSFRERPFEFRHNIELFEVSNGMKVALIPDTSTNLATVDLRFDVGAAEDPVGRAGLAHLVEHLVFEYRATPGGPTLGDELNEVSLYTNAFTSWDATHYVTLALTDNLPKVIQLEGRRWQAPCSQLDEATFRRELNVVLQETRQRGESPMLTVLGAVFGKDHPYARSISNEEVGAATREEFCAFLEKHYAPDRAYMVVTGNFNSAQIREQIGRTFGPIRRQAGPRAYASAANLDGKTSRHTAPVEDPTTVVLLSFPAWGGDDIAMWEIMANRLSAAMSSADAKLDWISSTAVYPWVTSRARVLVVEVQVGSSIYLERAADEVFERIKTLRDVPSETAQQATVAARSLAYFRQWDSRLTRGAWITDFMQYTQDNWFMLKELRALHTTKFAVAVPAIVDQWDRDESHVAFVEPSGSASTSLRAASGSTHEQTPWRAPVDPADADRAVDIEAAMPSRPIEEFTLDNGLHVMLAPARDSQMLDARLIFPVGAAHAPAGSPYLATAAAYLMGIDTETLYYSDSLEKLRWALQQDTVLDADLGATTTTFSARGSAQWSDWHVWSLGWWVKQGTYDKRALRRVHRAANDLATAEESEEDDEVERTMNERLFGKGHPYANPPGASAAILGLAAPDLQAWKDSRFRARGATLVVSGGFDVAEMREEIERHFGDWDGEAPPPLPQIEPIRPADRPSWLAVPQSDALQTRVTIATPVAADPEREAARAVLLEMLEDGLRDIREGMGATYSISVGYTGGPGGMALGITALIDAERAPQAVERMLAIVDGLSSGAAAQREAFVRARKKVLAMRIASASGAGAIADQLEVAAATGQGSERARKLADRIAAMTPADVAAVAAAELSPERRIVFVRGKRKTVDAVYATLAVTPEYIGEEANQPAEPATPDAPAEPTGGDTTAAGDDEEPPKRGVAEPREQRDYLFLGDEGARAEHQPGKYYLGSRELTLDEFLALGKADYVAKRVKRRRLVRRSLLAGAVVGVVGGMGMWLAGGKCDAADFTNQNDLDDCVARRGSLRTGSIIMVSTGLVLGIARTLVSDGKPDDDELLEIADRYNNPTD